MRKGPNNRYNLPDKTDLTLPRSKILRGRKNFQRLFEDSRQARVLRSSSVNFRYRVYEDPAEGCLIGFIVKTKLGKAAKRNRIKRLLREVYRTHQHFLSDLFDRQVIGFHGVFMARHGNVSFESLEADMVPLLQEIRGILINHIDSVTPVKDLKKDK